MKRSKMLSKIASVIINYNEVDSVIKREKALEMAETILQVQEEAGMLPPQKKGEFCWECGEAKDNLKWSEE